jgi:diguanylate cyclase (GGDEF)-like protein
MLVVSFGAAVATRYWLVLPKLHEMEASSDRKDLRRVLLAIDTKKLQLSTLAYQNAVWNEMYQHAQDIDPAFLDTLFPIDMMISLNIDMVALFDPQQRLIDHRLIDEQNAMFSEAPLSIDDVRPYLVDLSKVRDRAPIFDSGYLLSARGPLLYGTASVMRSDATGQPLGNLFYATEFDAEFIKDIEVSAQIHITASPAVPSDAALIQPSIDQVYRDRYDRIVWILTDNRQRPTVKLLLKLPQRDFDLDLWSLPLLVSLTTSICGALLMVFIFQRALVNPLVTIGAHLRGVRSHNDYAQRLNSTRGNELGDLSRDIDALVHSVQIQQDQLQAQASEMQALSFQDGLTGLANRRRFDQSLVDNWAHAQRSGAPLALLIFDVDYFKNYNDHYGHQLGDEALKRVAAILRRVIVRQSDLAARYGGEEFAVLLPDTTEVSAVHIAERVQQELRAANITHDRSAIGRRLTISIGIAAMVPDLDHTPRDLVHRADTALYSAKGAGRNRIMLASELPE